MKNKITSGQFAIRMMIAIAISTSVFTGCKKDKDEETTPATVLNFTLTTLSDGTIQVEGTTNQSITWDSSKTYLVKGFVYVDQGGVLNIQPGTVIKGDKASKGSLIIKRGGKINAVGTAAFPIVFTSSQAIGTRNPGDWGGIIICGNSPINLPNSEGQIEGGPDALYGGTVANDNSGALKYVRIEYAGIPFQPNQEINGLTLGGVGSATEIDYIQISYSGDDAYEMFGGNVNLKHIISFKTTDDDLDTDNGYSGKIQFG
ncbi:MAG: T9SS C-terminal target domain-containing protein, partial [Bacteroidetes bacterium]|nr:T9SS C-terminal target domain-containing protein [Bacteroidota bacterium]